MIDEFLPVIKGDLRAHVSVTINRLISIRGIKVLEPVGKSVSVEMPASHNMVSGFPSTFYFITWRDLELEKLLERVILAKFQIYREYENSRPEERQAFGVETGSEQRRATRAS